MRSSSLKGPILHNLVTVWRRSVTAELCWLGAEGPVGIPVVPLMWDDHPCVALPLAHLGMVDTMTSGRAVFALTGAAPDTGPALAGAGRVDIRFDLDGTRFVEHLLDQEITKHPPSRLRADGLMTRRENWWWVPRVLITLIEAEDVRELPARTRPEDALLVRARGPEAGAAGPRVDVVTAAAWPADTGHDVELWRRDGAALEGAGEPAFVFGHQHSPDFERWERWHRSGALKGDTLVVASGAGGPAPAPAPFGFLERWRNHRGLARACKAGIAAAESRRAAAPGGG
ncbi:MAG: hypothetical protein M0026_16775 [Nocardiopsaceae bacterium]|nr:hypothetical protein [Nocardiopsaceae bacterium]